MSGGVDSSVAAALLQREGHEVVGCFMRLGSPGDALETAMRDEDGAACRAPTARIGHQGCCSINDAADARLVAARLGIPFYVVNFRDDFGRIVRYFEDEYHAGRTPNPCVRCNDWLKFGKLRTYAAQLGCDAVATGHYARIDRSDGTPRIARGLDRAKDQSYVLFGTGPEAVASMLLPVGGMAKGEVRALAAGFDLHVSDKPDSQEICFVPDDYASFLARRARPTGSRRARSSTRRDASSGRTRDTSASRSASAAESACRRRSRSTSCAMTRHATRSSSAHAPRSR